MKKTFKLDEIDCANCAAKLERKISKVDGVKSCRIAFITQKLTLEAADEGFDDVFERVEALVAREEPDCEIVR